jgi:catechol-2,3-dioxygenase
MGVLGIDRVIYGVEDVDKCRKFFLDWGLRLVAETGGALDFETLNGCEVLVRPADDPKLPPAIETGPTLRHLIWGVEQRNDLDRLRKQLGPAGHWDEGAATLTTVDPNGLTVGFRITRKRNIEVHGVPMNAWGLPGREINQRGKLYDHAEPVEVGHVVFFTDRLAELERFYVEKLGFCVSDRYPGSAVFLRCSADGGHHDMFLLQPPVPKRGLHHVAFTVRDIHEVFGGGIHISQCGWETELGPGRHPISSAYFWYVKNPAGALVEYYTDEDHLDEQWQPREFEQKPELFAEWAVIGGIDGHTRRAKAAPK